MSIANSLFLRAVGRSARFSTSPSPSSSVLCRSKFHTPFCFHHRILAAMSDDGASGTLETLKFVNGAIKKLPLDSVRENYVRTVQGG